VDYALGKVPVMLLSMADSSLILVFFSCKGLLISICRKSDIVNNYTVWEEASLSKEVSEKYKEDSMNGYFYESILPRLIQRVPSFKDSTVCIQNSKMVKKKSAQNKILLDRFSIALIFLQLLSYDSGLIDVCTWDSNPLIGPILGFYNVIHAGGFDNNGV